jgi:hypothetical protein
MLHYVSQERMVYQREKGQVAYRSKDGSQIKVFDVLEWPRQKAAGCKHSRAMCSHVPNRGEQLARYYGYYSNVSRGKRKKAGEDDKIPGILAPDLSNQACRRSWARLIQKIYEVDPLVCPKCSPKERDLRPE